MRGTFIRTLAELAARDSRIVLLTADLGYTVLEEFAKQHPGRFFNVGVAEQNMVGLATGLAQAGFIPFAYSIATFATLRPYEFIRNGPVFQRLPVRVVGVGGGFEYGSAGASHHALEDVGVWRMHPDMYVIAPADYEQAAAALRATWELPSPIYYRLGKSETARVPGLEGRFALGEAQIVREGADLAILALGAMATEAAAAADILATDGVEATVVVVASVNPAPEDDLAEMLSEFDQAMTVEAHYRNGGLGSLVSEVVASRGIQCTVTRCGVEAGSAGVSGSEQFMHGMHGISRTALAAKAKRLLSTRAAR